MRVTIGTANIHQRNNRVPTGVARATFRLLPRRAADIWGLQECAFSEASINAVPRYEDFQSKSRDWTERSNAILMHERNAAVSYQHVDAVSGVKHGDVWGASAPRDFDILFWNRGKTRFVHITTHFHYIETKAVYGRREDQLSRASQQHRDHALKLVALVQKYKSEGYIVTVTADGNISPWTGRNWRFASYYQLERAGMKLVRNNIDWIAYFPDQLTLKWSKTMPINTMYSDTHCPVVAGFAVNNKLVVK